MAKHRLDLLPLLDVFMVVLFVFATLQEQQLDESSQNRERLEAELQSRQAALEALQDVHKSTPRAQEEPAASAAKRELSDLRTQYQEREADLERLRRATESTLLQLGANDDQLRRQDVLAKLLDRYSVFEIEIAGASDPEGPINRCCFRIDPLATRWDSCGTVPNRRAELDVWIAAEGNALGSALRRTKGGNAMTIVRQDLAAKHRLSATLTSLLRTEFEDHQIYDAGATLMTPACSP